MTVLCNPKYRNILPCHIGVPLQMWTSSSSSFSSAISSTSLSSSTSSSSPSPYAASNLRLPNTMEEVWKDITLAASDLHHLHPSSRGMVLQDFFSQDPPPTSVPSPASPPPQPPTMLTLNSRPDRFGPLLFQPHHQMQPMSHVSSTAAAFDAVVPDDNGKKRFPEIDRSSGDRRHKRMIKNRESAARSRARKQESISSLSTCDSWFSLFSSSKKSFSPLCRLIQMSWSLK